MVLLVTLLLVLSYIKVAVSLVNTTAGITEHTDAASTTMSTTSTTVKDDVLTEKSCEDQEQPPHGEYRSIELEGTLYPKDEFTNITFRCELVYKPKACKTYISNLANTTQLYMTDGTRISYISRKFNEVDDGVTIKFVFSLNHTQHHQKACACRTDQVDGLLLKSEDKNFGSIGAHWPVFISPKSVFTDIGTTFNLTCFTNHSEATDSIVWYRKLNAAGASYSRPLFTGNNSDGNIVVTTDTNKKMSILTIKQTEEWKGTFKCETKGFHSNPPYDTAMVKVKRKDRTMQDVSTIIGCSVSLLLVLIILGLVLRKRALKKKIEIANMLMDVREQHAETQIATANTTLINIDEPASNCYSIEGLNLGMEALGVESLAEIFGRLTSRWSSWQIDRSRLEIRSILGEGNFGSVYLGSLQDQYVPEASIQVAVKTIKASRLDKQAIKEFEKEISVMTALQHDHIVCLIGLCTEAMPLNIIMEYMKNGPLNTFLMEKAPNKLQDTELTTGDLLYMGIQPCKALEYLTNKCIVHRDISARNCLVGENYIVKLADFGLSRGTMDEGKNYYKKDGGMVPVKWMSPEALTFGKYTSSSDVWACAVLLWEIFSFGAVPYQGYSNQQVIVFVNDGGRLEKPNHCPQEIWKYITMCWLKSPEDRITISGLSSMLNAKLDCMKRMERDVTISPQILNT